MPRKKKGMKFELLPGPSKGEDGKPLLYPHPAIGRKWSMRWLDDFCNKYRGMSKGELIRVFETFLEVAAFHMEDGSRIETPFGSFAPKLKMKGNFTDPAKVSHDDVYFDSIEFIPSKRFKHELEKRLAEGFLKVTKPNGERPEPDEASLEEALQRSLSKGYTTVATFSCASGLKYKTAQRYLNNLCKSEIPRLQRYKDGNAWHYKAITQKKE